MTVRELFDCMNTDAPSILIYDSDHNVVYSKKSGFPVVNTVYYERTVAWIYESSSREIRIRIE